MCFSLLGILDLLLNFPGFHRWKFTDVLRNVLKIIVSLAWAIILPLFYVNYFNVAPNKIKDMLSSFREMKDIPQLYILVVALYMLPNILAAALFIFPMFRRWIENSDWLIIRFLLWWSQVWSLPCFPVSNFFLLDTIITALFLYFLSSGYRNSIFFSLTASTLLQPRIYVGRGMHDSQFSLIKWVWGKLIFMSYCAYKQPWTF